MLSLSWNIEPLAERNKVVALTDMPPPRQLKTPPITEALFDIRVKARRDFIVTEFAPLKDELSNRFMIVDERRSGKITIQIPAGEEAVAEVEDLGLHGYFFKAEDENLIAQFRVDGFTLNKLRPYTSWEDLIPTVVDLWEMYYSLAQPEAITRIATRFINHIPIKGEYIDFDEYLTSAPQIPSELPQLFGSFFSRATIVDEDRQVAANVVQTFESDPDISGIKLILDIDAFKRVDMEPDDPELVALFSQLREFKNMIFFNYLTKKTLEMFI